MSDIRVSLVDGFHSMQSFVSCDRSWFVVDDMCITFYLCPNCTNKRTWHEQCQNHGGQLACHVLNNVTVITPGMLLDKQTNLSLFWNMFHQVEDMTSSHRNATQFGENDRWSIHQKNFAVNDSNLCVAFNASNQHVDSDVVLAVSYYDIIADDHLHVPKTPSDFLPMWSVIHQLNFTIAKYKHLSLCEKPVVHTAIFTNCSDLYMSCHEGTCIHDSLVCDGHAHCPHGEDETDCQHICSNHSHNCMSHCHHRDLCSCSSGYFQCLSGGCVPLQKLCDKTAHCTDASDEPPTCVYLRPEELSSHSLLLDVNNYINALIQQNMAIHHNGSLLNVQNVEYKMHSRKQRCSASSISPDIKFPCGVITIWKHGSSPPMHYFSLDRLCVYDHDCDDNYHYHCFNGFHLLKCEDMYCVGRFKCPSSYCISFDHICNKVCDCPHCEDESICNKLLCPGMVLIGQIGFGLRCSEKCGYIKVQYEFETSHLQRKH